MVTDPIKELLDILSDSKCASEAKSIVRKWLGDEAENDDVEQALLARWQDIPAESDAATQKALASVYSRIASRDRNSEKDSLRKMRRRTLRYAAIIIPMCVISSALTFFFVKSVPDNTASLSELVVNNGDMKEMELSDGSSVQLNAGSILIHPDEFRGDSRGVYFAGEALFDIAHDPDKPFIVRTGAFDVEVLGTRFNLSAYPDADNHTTTLIEGRVRITPKDSDKSFMLYPNQQLIYNKTTGKFFMKDADVDIVTAWTRGQLIFRDATIKEIFTTLERRYDVVFQYSKAHKIEDRFNIRFKPGVDVEETLQVLNKLIGPFRYELKDNTYTLIFK